MQTKLLRYTQLLDTKEYFLAHEVLEEVWFARRFEDSAEVKLLKGLINASVSLELLQRGREEASQRVWKNYEKYKPYMSTIDTEKYTLYKKVVEKVDTLKQLKV